MGRRRSDDMPKEEQARPWHGAPLRTRTRDPEGFAVGLLLRMSPKEQTKFSRSGLSVCWMLLRTFFPACTRLGACKMGHRAAGGPPGCLGQRQPPSFETRAAADLRTEMRTRTLYWQSN